MGQAIDERKTISRHTLPNHWGIDGHGSPGNFFALEATGPMGTADPNRRATLVMLLEHAVVSTVVGETAMYVLNQQKFESTTASRGRSSNTLFAATIMGFDGQLPVVTIKMQYSSLVDHDSSHSHFTHVGGRAIISHSFGQPTRLPNGEFIWMEEEPVDQTRIMQGRNAESARVLLELPHDCPGASRMPVVRIFRDFIQLPDGAILASHTTTKPGDQQTQLMLLDELKPLSTGELNPVGLYPELDGVSILLRSPRGYYVADVRGDQVTELLRTGAYRRTLRSLPALSDTPQVMFTLPNGTILARVTRWTGPTIADRRKQHGWQLLRADKTTREEPLFDCVSRPFLAANGDLHYFAILCQDAVTSLLEVRLG